MRTVCIVQARMGSKRLPGKVLLPLNGHTVIEEVLSRCKRIPGVDAVVGAVPLTKANARLSDVVCDYLGSVYGGPGTEDDVLARYYNAANSLGLTGADIIVRVTGDCPLICPELCGAVIEKLKSEGADYASNIEPRTFPQGMDCEAFTMNTLTAAHSLAGSDEREHVTTWMREADLDRVHVSSPWPLEGRLTLDTEDDYKTICAYFGHKPYESGQHIRAA